MISLRRTIATGTFFLTVGNVLSRIVSLATVIIVTRALSLREYGIVTLAIAVTGPVFSITSLGMDEVVVSEAARAIAEKRPGAARSVLTSFIRLRFALLALLVAGGWALRAALTARYGPAFAEFFWILALYVIVQEIRSVMQIVFQIGKRFGVVAAANTGELFVKLLAVTGFALAGGLTVENVLAAYVIAGGAVAVATLPSALRVLVPLGGVAPERKRVLIPIFRTFGKWQTAQTVASSGISSFKYFLINSILSTEAVAIFSVAQSMYSTATSFLPLKFVLFPILAGVARQEARARELVARATKYALILYAVLMAGVWVVAAPLIHILFPRYVAAIPVIMLMALRLPLNAFSIAQAPILTILRRQKAQFWFTAASGVSVILLAPPLMYRFGLIGVVFEWIATALLSIVLREIYLRRVFDLASVKFRTFWTFDAVDRELLRQARTELVRRFPFFERVSRARN